ncbi:hypothetical protein AB9P05_02605 [Roseivirga sp. BDSF3-8]|uniref:hypothetical protein n=1 Tax=Roseivirga sp. BDSF3-8 TaxID=3241598 RepID=UPI0035326A96
MNKLLLPMLLVMAVACGSPEKKEQPKEEVTETTPDMEGDGEEMEPARTVELPEDINQDATFAFENDSVRQEITVTVEGADDIYLLYTVRDPELTCALRYEGGASALSGQPELMEMAKDMEVSFPAKKYIYQDELCSLLIFLADDRSQVEIEALDCEKRYHNCPAWSLAPLTRVTDNSNPAQ